MQDITLELFRIFTHSQTQSFSLFHVFEIKNGAFHVTTTFPDPFFLLSHPQLVLLPISLGQAIYFYIPQTQSFPTCYKKYIMLQISCFPINHFHKNTVSLFLLLFQGAMDVSAFQKLQLAESME